MSALDGGECSRWREWSASFVDRCTPRKSTPLLIEFEAVWAPEPKHFREEEILLLVLAFEPWTVKPVAS